MIAVIILVLKSAMSLTALVILLTSVVQVDHNISKTVSLLVSSITATRVSTLEIQQSAIAALYQYLVRCESHVPPVQTCILSVN